MNFLTSLIFLFVAIRTHLNKNFLKDRIFKFVFPAKNLISFCRALKENFIVFIIFLLAVIVVGDYSGRIQVYNENKVLTHNFIAHFNSNISNCIEFLKYLPCGDGFVASVADDAWVKIWRISDWNLMTAYNGHRDEIFAAEYICDDTIATGSLGKSLIKKK